MKPEGDDALTLVIFCLALSILLSGCAITGSKPVTVGCQAFDTWTTLRGLDLGAEEINPFLGGSPGQVIATKTIITGLLLAYHEEIGPKANTFINVITCGAAIHNLGVISDLKRDRQAAPAGGPMIGIGVKF